MFNGWSQNICFTHGQNQGRNIFSKKTPRPPGSLMVDPLFIDEENSKLPPKYSNCGKFGHFVNNHS